MTQPNRDKDGAPPPQNLTVQNLMDSFCQCFGSVDVEEKRTRSLKLKDKQWDQLFDNKTALSQAKLAAAKTKKAHKRRRSSSKEDIFRNKRQSQQATAFGRFLSSNPVVARSLCFANPIRDDDSDYDASSVVSDSNTLNTAEDTMTSTVYYETTKLAGLRQTHPPMPLFNNYSVQDDIHKIVETGSHSSKLRYHQSLPDITSTSSDSSRTPS